MNNKTAITTIPITQLIAMRALCARSIDSLQWRHSGIGTLQAYLYEGEVNEMRIHIWHPALKKDMKDRGDIHDHRFTLRSHVLHGGILQTEYEAVANPAGTWRCHAVTHARKALEATGTYHEADTDSAYACDVQPTFEVTVPAGSMYEFPKRAFHCSETSVLTVTVVEKMDQDDIPARILSRLDAPIVHAFTDTMTLEEFAPYLLQAKAALLSDCRIVAGM